MCFGRGLFSYCRWFIVDGLVKREDRRHSADDFLCDGHACRDRKETGVRDKEDALSQKRFVSVAETMVSATERIRTVKKRIFLDPMRIGSDVQTTLIALESIIWIARRILDDVMGMLSIARSMLVLTMSMRKIKTTMLKATMSMLKMDRVCNH